jgi:hypothetical protein
VAVEAIAVNKGDEFVGSGDSAGDIEGLYLEERGMVDDGTFALSKC